MCCNILSAKIIITNRRSAEYKEIVRKCINCMKETKRLNLGLDEDHATYSRECRVYQNNV